MSWVTMQIDNNVSNKLRFQKWVIFLYLQVETFSIKRIFNHFTGLALQMAQTGQFLFLQINFSIFQTSRNRNMAIKISVFELVNYFFYVQYSLLQKYIFLYMLLWTEDSRAEIIFFIPSHFIDTSQSELFLTFKQLSNGVRMSYYLQNEDFFDSIYRILQRRREAKPSFTKQELMDKVAKCCHITTLGNFIHEFLFSEWWSGLLYNILGWGKGERDCNDYCVISFPFETNWIFSMSRDFVTKYLWL